MLLLPALLIGLAIQCLIGSLIGAVILRASCAAYNRFFGGSDMGAGVQPPETPIASAVDSSHDVDSPDDVPLNVSPYASPVVALNSAHPERPYYVSGVPSPDFGKAFVICVITSMIQIFIGFFAGLAIGFLGGEEILFLLMNAVMALFGFLILAWIIQIQLPTSFGRALGVAGVFFLISLTIAIALVVIILLASSVFATFV